MSWELRVQKILEKIAADLGQAQDSQLAGNASKFLKSIKDIIVAHGRQSEKDSQAEEEKKG